MGEIRQYQPLTAWDKVTVVLYRLGIASSSLILIAGAYLFLSSEAIGLIANALLILLYAASGLSVFFIHLYVRKFKRNLIVVYAVALGALFGLFALGGGDPIAGLTIRPYGPLFLLPLSCCLGFVGAKEAFCFKLMEGYLLAIAMPMYLLMLSSGAFGGESAGYGLSLIAALHTFFTLRKVFQPLHYDIGDKSAYC